MARLLPSAAGPIQRTFARGEKIVCQRTVEDLRFRWRTEDHGAKIARKNLSGPMPKLPGRHANRRRLSCFVQQQRTFVDGGKRRSAAQQVKRCSP